MLELKNAVEMFFRSTREAFAFLEEHGGVYRQQLELLDSRRTRTVALADFKGDAFFLAEACYAGEDWDVRITYGDREYLINTIVSVAPPRGRVDSGSIWRRFLALGARPPSVASFALWEWLAGLECDPTPAEHAGSAATSADVDRVVRGMGAALSVCFSTIRQDAGALSQRVRERREQRMLRWREESLADRHRYAAAQAADAFRRKDYHRVVELLQPLEARLTPAERKKMQFARDRLTGGTKR